MTSQQPLQKPRFAASSSQLQIPGSSSNAPSSGESNPSPLLPPFVPQGVRPSMSRQSSLHTGQFSQRFLTPSLSTANIAPTCGLRLLMPTVRHARLSNSVSPTSRTTPASKASPVKSRSRAGSVVASLQPSPDLSAGPSVSVDWVGGGSRFEVVEEQIELEGYQIYAVEKWIVERKRVTVLTVYTGDPTHKITVTALSPVSSLSQVETQLEWEKAIHQLRRDGARPKETDKGIVMVTSLANFRSDYTIVHIPGGNFLEVKEQLHANINLLRMGCSGRSALTLEELSDTTKDRFISAYSFPDKAIAPSPTLFRATVLELVKLMQAGLAVCGMFDLAKEDRNGLLCDKTCDGLQRWVTEIGEPCIHLEPMERVADPTLVSALFSTILTMRNRLHAMGHLVPKDPFIDPLAFVKSLTNFTTVRVPHVHAHSLSLTQFNIPPMATLSPYVVNTSPVQVSYLSQTVIDSINAAYDKAKQGESYKVHRVLFNKLDDLATDLRTNPEHESTGRGLFGWASGLGPTTDLPKFVKIISASSKDSVPSLRYLWTGRPTELAKKRREKETALSEGEEREAERERDERDRYDRENFKSSDDEDDGIPWSGKVQRKLESWALGRSKKVSGDFGGRSKGFQVADSPLRPQSGQSSVVPSVIVSKESPDDDDILTSGQVSPISGNHIHSHLLGFGQRSETELAEFNRRLLEFNQKNPPGRPSMHGRVVTWAGGKDSAANDDVRGRRRRALSPLARNESARASRESFTEDEPDTLRARRRFRQKLKRRRSADDIDCARDIHILPFDRMRLDVELSGQLLVMHRREQHLANVIFCLNALTGKLSTSNARLHADYTAKQAAIDAVRARAGVLQDIEEARTRADAMTQETNALAYESAQFLVEDLWNMASAPRRKVFEMRERVFGVGKRIPPGVRGAHGYFNREQWTLGGEDRLVDALGRTESEAEEEHGLPGTVLHRREGEEGEVMEHANLKPTWLLRMFHYWGNKWGASRAANGTKEKGHGGDTPHEVSPVSPSGSSTALRRESLTRTSTT